MTSRVEQGGGLGLEPNPERRIIVDHKRVNEVLGKLVCAEAENEFPYNLEAARLPHDHRNFPENLHLDSTEHAMFLWTACYYMRGGIKSNDAVKRLAAMYDETPELFVAEQAMTADKDDIATLLTQNGLGYQATVSRWWVENASRLFQRFEGDPRRIFEGVSNYSDALVGIKNDQKGGGFIGFQEKMVSMITYYLMDESLIDPFEFPLPVDFHVLRMTVANELVRFEGYDDEENLLSDELLQVMRDLYYNYAVKHGISTLRLCDAVWLLSQTLCGMQPGNIMLEPGGRAMRKGRKTNIIPMPIDPESPKQQRAYEKSCASCPAESTCRWNVPGKIYYVQGEIQRRGERIKFT